MRIADIDPERLTPAQRRVHDAIVAGPRGSVPGPLRVWLQSPELADKAQQLGAFCRYGTSLPPRLSELAILVVGAHWQSSFEFWAHARIAREAGIAADVIEAIRTGAEPRLVAADERAVHSFARELVEQRRVGDRTYAGAVAELGETAVVELVGILGYYSLVSMTLNVFEVPVPEGEVDPFGEDAAGGRPLTP